MGVGTPINLLEGIERGIDMFDCIMPTRNGRNGQLFTRFGTINMRNKKWENDFSPVDPDGHSYVDTLYSKAYLHHLIKAKEMLGLQIASIHNLAFYLWLVKEARAHIIGTISDLDVPLNPYAKGELSLGAWFAGITEEELQEERNQILTAQPEDIQALGDLVEAVLKQRNICVVGSESALEKNREILKQIEPLVQ